MSRPDFVTCDKCRSVARRRKTRTTLGDGRVCRDEMRCHDRRAGVCPRRERPELSILRGLDRLERQPAVATEGAA